MKIVYFLNNSVRKMTKQFTRNKCFREYADIHRVVVLFDLIHAEEVNEWTKTLIADGKEVFCVSFNPNTKLEPPKLPENFTILNPKNLTYMGFPQHDVMESFKLLNSDTLLDLTVQPHPVLQYLSLKSEASFRVGFLREGKTFDDLLLEYDPGQGFVFLTSQLHFYMKSIRSK